MTPVILLGLLTGLPLILFMVLRVKPLYLFVSIVTGYLWVQFLGEPAELVIQSLSSLGNPDVVARLLLLAIPLALTLLFMRGTLAASALPFQLFLLVANSLLLCVLVINLLPGGVQDSLRQTFGGQILRQSSDAMVPGIAGLHLLVMWVMRPKHAGHGHHKKKH